MKRLNLYEAEEYIVNLPYYSSIWEEGTTDKYIYESLNIREKINHAEYSSGVITLKNNLLKIEALLRFYEEEKPNDYKGPDLKLSDKIHELKYARMVVLKAIRDVKLSTYIEIEE